VGTEALNSVPGAEEGYATSVQGADNRQFPNPLIADTILFSPFKTRRKQPDSD